jgi:hypothetical protein
MKTFLNNFNILNNNPNLIKNNYKNNDEIFSSIISILVIISIIILSSVFIHETIKKENPNIRWNLNEENYPNINLSDFPFMFGVSYADYSEYDPTVYHIRLEYVEYINTKKENGSYVQTVKSNFYPLVPCEGLDYGKYTNLLSNQNRTNFLCLEPNRYNITLSGIFSNIGAGFTYMNLYLNRCFNSTGSDIICKSEKEINEKLKNLFLMFIHPKYEINHLSANPFILKVQSNVFSFSTTIFKRIYFDIWNVIYDTDEGLIFENRDIYNKFITSYFPTEVSIDLKTGAYANPTAFGQFTYRINRQSYLYNRSYDKLQSLIAKIGGIVSLMKLIGLIIVRYISIKIIYKRLVEKTYENI